MKVYILSSLESYFAEHGPLFPQQFGQGPCVDAVDARYVFFSQPVWQRPFGLPVAGHPAVVLAYYGLAVYVAWFEIIAYVVLTLNLLARHSVVAQYRIGGDQYLSLVRGVGEAFWIAGHCSVEHNFAGAGLLITERESLEDGAILEGEESATGSVCGLHDNMLLVGY